MKNNKYYNVLGFDPENLITLVQVCGGTYLWWRTQYRFTPPRAALVAYAESAGVRSWYIMKTLGNDLGMDVYAMSANTFLYDIETITLLQSNQNNNLLIMRKPVKLTICTARGTIFHCFSTFYGSKPCSAQAGTSNECDILFIDYIICTPVKRKASFTVVVHQVL